MGDAGVRRDRANRAASADLLVYSALVVVVIAVYRRTLAVYFLNEDFSWLWRCRLVPPTSTWTLLTRDVMQGLYSWRPLVQLSFGLNEAAWGVHPLGYRVTALLWQALAAGLLYAIVRRVAGPLRGGLAALLFAVHPVHVESLSWTCARGAPISTAFVLLALFGYLAWRRGDYRKQTGRHQTGRQQTTDATSRQRSIWVCCLSVCCLLSLWLVLLPFALALATLESSVVFVGLVLAADGLLPAAPLRVGHRLQLYGGLVAVLVGFLWLHRTGSSAVTMMNMVGFGEHWPLSAGPLFVFVVRKLHAMAAMLLTLDPQSGWVTAAMVGAVVLVGVCWWRGQRLGVWGLVWIVLTGAPFTLLLLGPYPRHLHLVSVGFALLFAELLASTAESVGRWNRRLAVVCVAGLMVLWFARMVREIDQATAVLVERGRASAALLADLQRLVPQPGPGSELAFYGLGELRGQQQVFVYGFDDAVRLLYNDGSLVTHLGPRGSAPQATYQLVYADGHLLLLNGERQ